MPKPIGAALEQLIEDYYNTDHEGKVQLAEDNNVTYDTLKHWVSDSGLTRKQVSQQPVRISTQELLAMRPSVNLDFVCFDIETSNLTADFSVLLTAAIKPFDKPTMIFRADRYPEWQRDRANDYKIVKAVAEELRRHAIVVAHFGSGFDIPFLRAKMTKHGLEPLPLMYGIDTWRIAKQNFQVSSRRLKNLATFFDIGEKETVEGRLWMDAAYNGSKEAMDRIVEHNIKDVEILERLACISFPYLKSIPKL